MKLKTKNLLLEAWQFCDDNDKSTEFMLEYMQDVASVDLDCVVNFIQKNGSQSEIKHSDCCGAKIIHTDLCSKCKEHI